MQKNLKKISWQEVEEAVGKITKEVTNSAIEYAAVYGLPRGGLVAAVMLSHRLLIPIVMNLESVQLLRHSGNRVLIVDDISDTGKTLMHLKEDGYDLATLYVREHTTQTQPKYKGVSINYDDWLLFPWESEKEFSS